MISRIINPIYIGISTQFKRGLKKKSGGQVKGSPIYIMHNVKNNRIVSRSDSRHKLANQVNYIGNVKLHNNEIYKTPN